MKFFRKLKEKLFSTSSKIKDGLEGIIDNQSIENVQEEQSKQDKLDKSLSQKINENFEQKKEKTLEESHKNNITRHTRYKVSYFISRNRYYKQRIQQINF